MTRRKRQFRGSGVNARYHNLPASRVRLVGRDQDTATLRDLALGAPGRLVTLTGTGGCGKTQLALKVATDLVDTFPDGVWYVELASLREPQLVGFSIAGVQERRERTGQAIEDTLAEYLVHRDVLLVLDNCEHLIEACARLTEQLLSGCPGVRVLATSREALRVTGEIAWPVPSLASPDPQVAVTPAHLLTYPAAQLFVQRAQAVQPGFVVGPDNTTSVAALCAHLEGLPLALELAAARMAALSLSQIVERLDDCFRLLVRGRRTAPTRQQTLRATLDWSHGLLSPDEQVVFRQLAVFARGWSLGAAEAVCSNAATAPLDVLEILTRLVEKSLVLVGERDGRSRYRLLEPPVKHRPSQHTASIGISSPSGVRRPDGRPID
jgi:non-specific serine/threonine protein kinase